MSRARNSFLQLKVSFPTHPFWQETLFCITLDLAKTISIQLCTCNLPVYVLSPVSLISRQIKNKPRQIENKPRRQIGNKTRDRLKIPTYTCCSMVFLSFFTISTSFHIGGT
uniref:Uncharacterized protein n=1 Tax=Cacopsylla melanoneura TaxID=428564 RepID=A0A8D8TUH0_9HEMI